MEDALLAVAPALTAAGTYRHVLSGTWEFVYDDNYNFVDILELSWDRLKWYFSEAMVLGVYEPLSLTLKALVVHQSGWDPHAFHNLACALHAVNSIGAYFVGRFTLAFLLGLNKRNLPFGIRLGCAIASSLFACQPSCVQTVCWVSCLPYLFAAFFAQLSMLSLIRALSLDSASRCTTSLSLLFWRGISTLCYAAALLCKTAALPVVVVLCALDYAASSGCRSVQDSAVVIQPSLISPFKWALHTLAKQFLSIGIAVAALYKGTSGYHLEELVRLSTKETLLRACYLVLFYVAKIVDPWHDFNLMQLMPYDGIQGFLTHCHVCAAVLLVCVLWIAWAVLTGLRPLNQHELARRRRGTLGWLVACYVVMIAPGLGLHSHTSDQLYGDRYLYLPTALLLAPFGGIVFERILAPLNLESKVEQNLRSQAAFLPCVAAILASILVAFHVQRSSTSIDHWRNNRDLWAYATRVQSWNHRWWYHYAQELADSGWPALERPLRAQAVAALEEAWKIYPAVYVGIARAEHLHELGNYSEAVLAWEGALKHHSVDFENQSSGRLIQLPSEKYRILCGLGRSRLHAHDPMGAAKALAECLNIYPKHTAAVCTRRQEHAHAYVNRSMPNGVWWHQATGARGKPGVLCAMPTCARGCLFFYAGLAYFDMQHWTDSARAFQEAYNQRYTPTQAFLAWGVSLQKLGNEKGAQDVWKAALQASPPPSQEDQRTLRANLRTLDRSFALRAASGLQGWTKATSKKQSGEKSGKKKRRASQGRRRKDKKASSI
eukprot:TRINITY_DN9016_c0_g5_i2.p1 TRINITY_DN9016_c0_g5~~TRINITY_DN9016_c0_g5_i2.p1  ORF type:complete len:775 (-),score=87.34 TRINITY_DN9016_c0_g5_i2:183-2507(-)